MRYDQLRPVPGCARLPDVRVKLKPGDKVSWRNPATKVDYPGLEVLHVHKTTGGAYLKGWFGDYVRGKQRIEHRNAPVSQLTKEGA